MPNFVFIIVKQYLNKKNTDIQKLLTMDHSTTVLLDDGETLYVQGSLAVSPFNASTLGATSTVTAPRHTVEKNGQRQK